MKVLIVDVIHDSIFSLLEEKGMQADHFPDYDYNAAKSIIKNYEGLIIRSKFYIDDAFLEEAVHLKFIGRPGAGLDLIDLEACKKRDIKVFGANAGNAVAVAEHLMGLILSLFNNIIRANTEVRDFQWKREANRGVELMGKTVGLIGCGHNGTEAGKRLAAFGCRVLAYDKYKIGFGTEGIIESTLEEIFKEADILSLHIPLTEETDNWIDEVFFDQFEKNIYFFNVARGNIVNTKGLINAIKKGKVLGTGLDVIENEKLSLLNDEEKERFAFLKDHPAVIITPHIAGWTFESYEKLNKVMVEQIGSVFKVSG